MRGRGVCPCQVALGVGEELVAALGVAEPVLAACVGGATGLGMTRGGGHAGDGVLRGCDGGEVALGVGEELVAALGVAEPVLATGVGGAAALGMTRGDGHAA